MAERKTLLKRYGIPLDHLDFKYIKECNDAREMERIVHVLQSGEEGYFPDLTKCAEDKLRELKPNSRLFRVEEELQRQQDVNAIEVQPIYEFSKKVRDRDHRLATCLETNDNLPPPREPGFIKLDGNKDKKNENDQKDDNVSKAGNENCSKSSTRIKSTDYRKWDEYDPDAEILRMDLEEERVQEEVERKNRLNAKIFKQTPLITEIKDEEERLKKLSDIERDTLAEEHRLRGNDYYRAKEYKEALVEYSRAIAINPLKEAAAYNNRAMTNMKIKKFQEAIQDCEKCLSIEPKNVKAMYRFAESNMQLGLKEEALEMFLKVLDLEPNNLNAKNSVEYLRQQIGEKPPANATRLRIEEASKSTTEKKSMTNEQPTKKDDKEKATNIKATKKLKIKKLETTKDYDLAALVRPKELLPNKLMDTTANMFKNNHNNKPIMNNETNAENQKKDDIQTKFNNSNDDEIKIRLPLMNDNSCIKRDKPLIEEI